MLLYIAQQMTYSECMEMAYIQAFVLTEPQTYNTKAGSEPKADYEKPSVWDSSNITRCSHHSRPQTLPRQIPQPNPPPHYTPHYTSHCICCYCHRCLYYYYYSSITIHLIVVYRALPYLVKISSRLKSSNYLDYQAT